MAGATRGAAAPCSVQIRSASRPTQPKAAGSSTKKVDASIALSSGPAVTSAGSVTSGRAASSAAAVRFSHRYMPSSCRPTSAASPSAAGTMMPHSRSEAMPRSFASAKRPRLVRLVICTAVASGRSSTVRVSASMTA